MNMAPGEEWPLRPRLLLVILIWNAVIIFGGGAVFRHTPGPLAARLLVLVACIAVVAFLMYLTHWRMISRPPQRSRSER